VLVLVYFGRVGRAIVSEPESERQSHLLLLVSLLITLELLEVFLPEVHAPHCRRLCNQIVHLPPSLLSDSVELRHLPVAILVVMLFVETFAPI